MVDLKCVGGTFTVQKDRENWLSTMRCCIVLTVCICLLYVVGLQSRDAMFTLFRGFLLHHITLVKYWLL